ncbi:inorganic pyrophosphatase [Apiospora arundinis]
MLVNAALIAVYLQSSVVFAAALEQQQSNAEDVAPAASGFRYDDLTLREVGARNTREWRLWLEKKGEPISFWHDVPLWPDEANKQIVNFVVEIPRWTDAKLEIRRNEPLNPIFHDTKKKKPRFVESVWPHKSYPFVYGSIPQTWENPNVKHNFTGFPGDNDPIDLFDIGEDMGFVGQVKQVKVLGGLAIADGDETDWKMIGIDTRDPLASVVNSHEDLEKYRPGLTAAFRDWFTYYKVPRGDAVIPIAGGGSYQNVSHMVSVVEQGHTWWAELKQGKAVDSNEINYNQTSDPAVGRSYVESSAATAKFGIPASSAVEASAAKPVEYERWYYLDSDRKLIEVPG